jgi:hypothetical protein
MYGGALKEVIPSKGVETSSTALIGWYTLISGKTGTWGEGKNAASAGIQ